MAIDLGLPLGSVSSQFGNDLGAIGDSTWEHVRLDLELIWCVVSATILNQFSEACDPFSLILSLF